MYILDYYTDAYKGRWKRRALQVGVVLTCVAALAWDFGAMRLWHRMTYAIMWHRCETMILPAGTVVYEEDPTLAAKLLSDSSRYVAAAVRDPSEYPGGKPPVCYQYALATSVCPGELDPVAFLHARKTPKQVLRLVVVYYHLCRYMTTEGRQILLEGLALDRGSWAGPQSSEWSCGKIEITIAAGEQLRFMAGYPDPLDESHFFIPYAIDGNQGMIEGRLRDAGAISIDAGISSHTDFVELKVENGPLAMDYYSMYGFDAGPAWFALRPRPLCYASGKRLGLRPPHPLFSRPQSRRSATSRATEAEPGSTPYMIHRDESKRE